MKTLTVKDWGSKSLQVLGICNSVGSADDVKLVGVETQVASTNNTYE